MAQDRGKNSQQTPLPENSGPYILGLDIGTTSVGWAVIDSRNGKPDRLRQAGVRIFEAGVDGDIESGRDASRAAAHGSVTAAADVAESRSVASHVCRIAAVRVVAGRCVRFGSASRNAAEA